ncbi:hypothetical protein GN958_ATG16639 [Phytophthora infestans]|uniref:RxLR effector protein n=1 Tax=Phytophthora infestans TaxID=4787 RepID=A0A8S9U5L8_PHYIN|nr:hypothetical protein GN958_ATG16639 [Phytophthora infestans]
MRINFVAVVLWVALLSVTKAVSATPEIPTQKSRHRYATNGLRSDHDAIDEERGLNFFKKLFGMNKHEKSQLNEYSITTAAAKLKGQKSPDVLNYLNKRSRDARAAARAT